MVRGNGEIPRIGKPAPRPSTGARLAEVVTKWQVLLLAAVGLVSLGFSAALFASRFETKEQHGLLVDRAGTHEIRLTKLETDLDWIKRTLEDIDRRLGGKPSPPP